MWIHNHSNICDNTILLSIGWNNIFINTLKRGAVCVQNGVAAAAATVSFWNGGEKKDGKVFPSGTEE